MSHISPVIQRLRGIIERQPPGQGRLVNVSPADVRALCEAVEVEGPIKAALLQGTRRLPGDVTRVAVRADDLQTLLYQLPAGEPTTDHDEVPA